jgi:hypothetical protein
MTLQLSHNCNVALSYAKAGFFVFPCAAERQERQPRDRLSFGKAKKSPILVKHWLPESSKDEAQIRKWWMQSPEALVALPCKSNGLFVLDCDRHTEVDNGIAYYYALCEVNGYPPAHPVIETDYEGRHHIFKMPDEPIKGSVIGHGIETRGYQSNNQGNYIIAAGSRMPDGRAWKLVKSTPSLLTAELQVPPQWLIDLCRPTQLRPMMHTSAPARCGKREQAYAATALDKVARELAITPRGNRDNTLNKAAFCLGTMIAPGWIGAATVEGRLIDACSANGLLRDDAAKVRSTIKRAIDDGMKQPHAALVDRPKANGQTARGIDIKPPEAIHDWSDPDWSILDDRRGELPEFPLDLLPNQAREWVESAAHGAGVTPAHVAVPLLGAASSLIGTARRVQAATSWTQPLTTWTALVGFSGDGKTPGLDATRRALAQIELDRATEITNLRLEHEAKVEAAKVARDLWKKEIEKAAEQSVVDLADFREKKKAEPKAMPAEAQDPGRFIEPRLFISNTTIERVAPLLQAQPQGALVMLDELSAHFSNMSRYSGGDDRAFWLEAWNGGPYNVERMSRPPISIKHLLVGITGGFQPDKLNAAFRGDADGMPSRFCFAWIAKPKYRPLSNAVTEIEPTIINALGRLVKLPWKGDNGEYCPRAIRLSTDAVTQFEAFRKAMFQLLPSLDGLEREWFAKSQAHVLRLAGTLQYLDYAFSGMMAEPMVPAEPTEITAETMKAAIRLVQEYFWPHARACLRQIGLTERHANARKVLRWLAANRKSEVSREAIRREALGQRLDADQTTELLTALCNFGWMREEFTPSGPQGGKPVRRWLVNPKLFSSITAETAETAKLSERFWVSAVSAVTAAI